MIIYMPTDRIPVHISGLTLHVKPLNNDEQMRVNACAAQEGGHLGKYTEMAKMALKLGVRKIEGMEKCTFSDGSKVVLEQEENGDYTDKSLDILVAAIGNNPTQAVSGAIISGNNQRLASMVKVEESNTKKKTTEQPQQSKT